MMEILSTRKETASAAFVASHYSDLVNTQLAEFLTDRKVELIELKLIEKQPKNVRIS